MEALGQLQHNMRAWDKGVEAEVWLSRAWTTGQRLPWPGNQDRRLQHWAMSRWVREGQWKKVVVTPHLAGLVPSPIGLKNMNIGCRVAEMLVGILPSLAGIIQQVCPPTTYYGGTPRNVDGTQVPWPRTIPGLDWWPWLHSWQNKTLNQSKITVIIEQ